MRHTFEPSFEEIEAWCRSFVPEETLYWIDESFLKELPNNCLVLPRQEFFHHPAYRTPQLSNAYLTWMMGEGVTYIVHAPSAFLDDLHPTVKIRLLEFQEKMNRGLVLPMQIEQMSGLVNGETVEKDGQTFIILHQSNWDKLSREVRHSLMLNYAKEWDTWEGEACDTLTPPHLATFANTFPLEEGGNCLAATLFAITRNDWMIHQWIHPETFLQTIQLSGYETVADTNPKSGDVLTFWNEQEQLIHANYCIRPNLFFNKHGQVRFNPWKLIDEHELQRNWGSYRLRIKRKIKGSPKSQPITIG